MAQGTRVVATVGMVSSLPTDGMFGSQWYLHNTGQSGGTPGVDIDVAPVWARGITGRGVSIGVFDTAMDVKQSDLAPNIDLSKEITAADGSFVDPTELGPDDTHATNVGGLLAGARDGHGIVGVAYNAHITPVNVLTHTVGNYAWEALWKQSQFDISNNSWSFSQPFVNGALDDSTRYWVLSGFATGADTGRGGLGTLENVAAGNFRGSGQSTETSGLTLDRHVSAIGAVDDHGMASYYANPGASLLVVAPSSGEQNGVVTSAIVAASSYTADFGGTSATTPQASGTEALMLQADPGLGWRDVQDILALTARHTGSAMGAAPSGHEVSTWAYNHSGNWNGGGAHFSNDYGFGLIDARAAVDLATSWRYAHPVAQTSANEGSATAEWSGAIDLRHAGSETLHFQLAAGPLQAEAVKLDLFDLAAGDMGKLSVELVSPGGTHSMLLSGQGGGTSLANGWELMSRAFLGEHAAGTWTVHVTQGAGETGSLGHIGLTVYGEATEANPVFYYTNEFAQDWTTARGTLSHPGAPVVLDAAAVTTPVSINLGNHTGSIGGKPLAVANGTEVKTLIGGEANDVLVGNGHGATFVGGMGDDLLIGGGGHNLFDGGSGNNAIINGTGGSSTIVLHKGGVDAILDFHPGTDKLSLSRAEFSELGNGITSRNFVLGDSNTHLAGGGLVYDATHHTLLDDTAGAAHGTVLASFANWATPGAGDLVLV